MLPLCNQLALPRLKQRGVEPRDHRASLDEVAVVGVQLGHQTAEFKADPALSPGLNDPYELS